MYFPKIADIWLETIGTIMDYGIFRACNIDYHKID